MQEEQEARQAQVAENERVAQLLDTVSKATLQDIDDLDRAAVLADHDGEPMFECPVLKIECSKVASLPDAAACSLRRYSIRAPSGGLPAALLIPDSSPGGSSCTHMPLGRASVILAGPPGIEAGAAVEATHASLESMPQTKSEPSAAPVCAALQSY